MTATQAATTIADDDVLTIDHLRHTYNEGTARATTAVGDISLTVRRTEILAIVGPSGCGKTTLLRTIGGLQRPSAGEVRLGSEPIRGRTPREMAMVFQDYSRSLFPWLTVGGNITFGLTNEGLSKEESADRVQEAASAVGLASYVKHYPWQLSGGMQQRTAIARALARRPEILVMDEPFASVDAQTRAALEDLVLTAHERYRTTTVFVTHDIDESIYLADRVVVLSKSPSTVIDEVVVDLPRPRDQVVTRAEPKFVELRRHVAELIRQAAEDTHAA